ncbi:MULTISPECIES: hypothetical protein [Microbacterium]|uniref:hypothetical protein n=1 Tax=Microbacterium TaxID=33882 RepID=UPI00217D8B99|nr:MULTISPECIES: hypothetical protein [Microbacterium]UWF77588.1 hypothetical protein JSY13_00375 [Microbacterium neungamense]WCM55759.1 hypothetical protein JRG78_00390 [Microbacterium sp. EF45047]
MSAIKPIIRELKQAALRGFAHADRKLHQVTANIADHVDTVVRQVRSQDRFDDRPDTPRTPEPGTQLGRGERDDLARGGRYSVVFFDGRAQRDYYETENPTLGAEGRPFWVMPLEDGAHVSSASDAARATGMSPATMRAYTGYEIDWTTGDPDLSRPVTNPDDRAIHGIVFPNDAAPPQRTATAADADGWAHFLEGGHTAVNTGSGYMLNDVREFVMDGGSVVPPGSFGFQIGLDGSWNVTRAF